MRRLLILSVLLWGCASAPQRDVPICDLLTADDLQRVQGERPVEIKPSQSGAFEQCFYRLPTFTSSINLGVTHDGRALWQRIEQGGREEEEGEKSRTREVEGLGDDALWSPLPIGATLYVLRGDTMLRISIGGKMDDATRLENSIKLAKTALKRLR
jgi:hypothetical protein